MNQLEAPYYVWRRSDGYVSVTRYMPNGDFVLLLKTGSWPEAAELVLSERGRQTGEVRR